MPGGPRCRTVCTKQVANLYSVRIGTNALPVDARSLHGRSDS